LLGGGTFEANRGIGTKLMQLPGESVLEVCLVVEHWPLFRQALHRLMQQRLESVGGVCDVRRVGRWSVSALLSFPPMV
jgi:hypothetical protein